MILADTSVWINHFHTEISQMQDLLDNLEIATHEYILGELIAGNFAQRERRVRQLMRLTKAPVCNFIECRTLIEDHKFYGIGLSWGDIQLLCSAKQGRHNLWTFDKTLDRAARHLGVAYASVH